MFDEHVDRGAPEMDAKHTGRAEKVESRGQSGHATGQQECAHTQNQSRDKPGPGAPAGPLLPNPEHHEERCRDAQKKRPLAEREQQGEHDRHKRGAVEQSASAMDRARAEEQDGTQ